MQVAVILCGCGRIDGSEVQESVATLYHLSRVRATVTVFAPNALQLEVHSPQHELPTAGECRHMMAESARIARHPVVDVASLGNPDIVARFDALVIPGGFGTMKNLCDLAVRKHDGVVRDDVARAIRSFHRLKKPIVAICIAPVIVSRVLSNVRVTLGESLDGPWQKVAVGFGASLVARRTVDVCVDNGNAIVSTPAYMNPSSSVAEVVDGIGAAVDHMVALLRPTSKL